MQHLVQGKALKIQVAYLVADIVIVDGSLTCDVVVNAVCARSLSMVFVSLIMSSSARSSILALSCGKTGSCGSMPFVEVGSYVTTLGLVIAVVVSLLYSEDQLEMHYCDRFTCVIERQNCL